MTTPLAYHELRVLVHSPWHESFDFRMLKVPPKVLAQMSPKMSAGLLGEPDRVARWYIFIPKIPIWVYFGGPWIGKCWHILLPFGIFYGHLVYFMTIWYILWLFGIYFLSFGSCTKKIWQPRFLPK
jgi:hypothetical protein